MKCYIYAADIYCKDCGEDLKSKLTQPENPDDENTYDSDDYPKGPCEVSESDYPQHPSALGPKPY